MDGGGGRPSARATAAAAATTKNNKQKKNGMTNAPPPRDAAVPFEHVRGGISDALRGHLEALGATPPACVAWKTLQMSDVHKNQARLLFSCKGSGGGGEQGEPPPPRSRCPLAACLTEHEARFVADDAGLLVNALDRWGRSYDLTCKYLVSNCGYRFITGWKKLVEENGLRQGMRVELWAFRSPHLPNRCGIDAAGNKVGVREEIGHPDGSLGMVVLHYYDGERDLKDEHGEAAVQEAGKAAGQVKSEAAAAEPEEKKLAGGGAETSMTTMEGMVATCGLRTFLGAVGLTMLKRRYGEEQTRKEEENEETEKHKVQCLRKNVKDDVDQVM
ncbi:unnamed protein product [Urochloa decumbens]|uniref:TF-B3 domain-containing protein n=1 Tax=Urochloa decumbens TaxID=240449 RepID=A0ABC8ZB62_9POAL